MDRLVSALESRLGEDAALTSQAAFKRDFAIDRAEPWTVMWDWPAQRAHEVINYLEGRYAQACGRPAPGTRQYR